MLPSGLGRFVPCFIGANHCRIRHIGWEKCGHGLTSRPRESASVPFLNQLLSLFNFPPGSARALLAGTLPFNIVLLVLPVGPHTWRLPVPGRVAGLVAGTSWEVQEAVAEGVGRRVSWVGDSGPNRRRIRLNRKTPAHLAGLVIQSRSRVWKRLRHVGHFSDFIPDRKRRRDHQDDGGTCSCSVQDWGGIIVQAHVSWFARFKFAGSSVHA